MLSLKERFTAIFTPRPQSLSLRRLSGPRRTIDIPPTHTPSMLEELGLVDAQGFEFYNADSYCAAIDAYLRGEIAYEHINGRRLCARRQFNPPTC